VDGQDDRFSMPGPTAPPGGGDFFGSTAPTGAPTPTYAASPAPPYGAPSAQAYGPPAPAPQYGAPPAGPAFGQPVFGAPYTSAPLPQASPNKGSKQVVGGVVALVVVLVASFYGWNIWKQHQPIHVPTTLGGQPVLHTAAVDAVVAQGQQDLESKEPGKHATAAAFGSATSGQIIILVGLRGRLISIPQDFASAGATSALSNVGKNTCATIPSGIMCERTSNHLTEGVIEVSKVATEPQVSALLDEAWSKA
jgi:hypothetical protein